MSLSKLKKVKLKKFEKKRKRHVETMFQSQAEKKFPFYYKSTLKIKVENNVEKFFLQKKFFYIKAKKNGFISSETLKSLVRIYKWFAKTQKMENVLKLKIFVFPDFNFTSKPKDVRMGKGKGPFKKKLAPYKKGQNIFSFQINNNKKYFILLKELLKKLIHKLPDKFFVAKKSW